VMAMRMARASYSGPRLAEGGVTGCTGGAGGAGGADGADGVDGTGGASGTGTGAGC
jgi:hypothetical protein